MFDEPPEASPELKKQLETALSEADPHAKAKAVAEAERELAEARAKGPDSKDPRVESSPKTGRLDEAHQGPRAYDHAIESARNKAGGDFGPGSKKMHDPETGTLIGEMSADGKRGWRIDDDHVNWWDWSQGKKGQGGAYGHDFFPKEHAGPHSKHIGYADWE
jgi:hypothetical protein